MRLLSRGIFQLNKCEAIYSYVRPSTRCVYSSSIGGVINKVDCSVIGKDINLVNYPVIGEATKYAGCPVIGGVIVLAACQVIRGLSWIVRL